MLNRQPLESMFEKYGFDDFKWISGKDIKVAQWVRFKCIYGCDSFGKASVCPPDIPSVSNCRSFFSEYESAAVFHFVKKQETTEELAHWVKTMNNKLSKLEKEVFLSGYHKTFVLFVGKCNICSSCVSERPECRNKKIARPCTEALAIDLYGTVKSIGYPLKVIKDEHEEMNRYAILLVE